jgi:hypothetical protein
MVQLWFADEMIEGYQGYQFPANQQLQLVGSSVASLLSAFRF